MNILDKIIAHKITEITVKKNLSPLQMLSGQSMYTRKTISLSSSLSSSTDINIIAEYKRASPSKGLINKSQSSPENIALQYEKYGATAMSVLTDTAFFQAQENDFKKARNSTSLPLLRKEFIIDEYQIHEAKAMGADLILLIAAVLSKEDANHYTTISHDLGMEVLYEIHDPNDIRKMPESVDIIGVNNRNLKTFEVDYQHSINMLKMLPEKYPKISESGISKPETVIQLHKAGFNGFLMGEAFMKAEDPGFSFQKFISNCHSKLKES